MNESGRFPSRDRLSVLTALIVLAYALARFLDLPARAITATLFGSALGFELSGAALMLLLVAALISTGSDALIRSHPCYGGRSGAGSLIHWILPGATALVLGAALDRLPSGPLWLVGLGATALAVLAVLVAEYLVVNPEEPARDAATVGLTALGYVLAVDLSALLASLRARAAITASVGGVVAAAIAWRLFTLNGAEPARAALPGGIVGVIAAEVTWALSYWRISPIGAALLTVIPFYVGIGLAQQHLAGRLTRRMWIEFAVVGALGLAAGLLFALSR